MLQTSITFRQNKSITVADLLSFPQNKRSRVSDSALLSVDSQGFHAESVTMATLANAPPTHHFNLAALVHWQALCEDSVTMATLANAPPTHHSNLAAPVHWQALCEDSVTVATLVSAPKFFVTVTGEFITMATLANSNNDDSTPSNRMDRNICSEKPEMSNRKSTSKLIPAALCYDDTQDVYYKIGDMSYRCDYCEALHFKDEQSRTSLCCLKGKIKLPAWKPVPLFLYGLLMGRQYLTDIEFESLTDAQKKIFEQSYVSKGFREYIRSYNSSLALASFSYTHADVPGHGPPIFRMINQIYRRLPHCPSKKQSKIKAGQTICNNDRHLYAQLYIYSPSEATSERAANAANHGCRSDILQELHKLLMESHPYTKQYKMMFDYMNRHKKLARDVRMLLGSDNRGTHNLPTPAIQNDVAAIIINQEPENPNTKRLLVVEPLTNHSWKHKFLNSTHHLCDPFIYPLMFPHGDHGWMMYAPQTSFANDDEEHLAFDESRDSSEPQNDEQQTRNRAQAGNETGHSTTSKAKKITMLQYYTYRLATRSVEPNPSNLLYCYGRVTQQYLVDAYAKVEENNLRWIRTNQTKLRVETYSGLQDWVRQTGDNDQDTSQLGKQVILPSSFHGSPRHMAQVYQDAMALVRRFGRPDLFITFTCNPNWPEIQNLIKAHQTSTERADIVSRVFQLKLKELLKDIASRNVFGESVAYTYVIEFQKRGLPHAHIVLTLQSADKPKDAGNVDSMVCAELPSPSSPLWTRVRAHMIHKCTVMCKVNGACKKGFPKPFQPRTEVGEDGFPLYRRRSQIDGGQEDTTSTANIDNRWVVPYNAYLLAKFDAHINVEICTSISAIKYLFKYIHKGPDQTKFRIEDSNENQGVDQQVDAQPQQVRDEIKEFQNARFLTPPEATWRLLSFSMHESSHSIERLAVHVEDGQSVYWHDGQDVSTEFRHTTLTAWFLLNQEDEQAHEWFYHEIPEHYVWLRTAKQWKRRHQGGNKKIGRMYMLRPKDQERFHLRLLLLHVKGATSFQDLRTFEGVTWLPMRVVC